MTGRVVSGSFPEPITRVRAVGTASITEAPVGADGSFTIRVPAQDRYRLELHGSTRQSDLVFPRVSGVIHTTFFVESGGAAIELGRVRYVSDPANATWDFNCAGHPEGAGICVEDGAGDGDGKQCGGDVGAPEGGVCGATGDGAVAETNPPEAVGCDGDGDGGGKEGDGDGGGGGGEGDTGGGGGGDTGSGGGQDPGPSPCGDGRCL